MIWFIDHPQPSVISGDPSTRSNQGDLSVGITHWHVQGLRSKMWLWVWLQDGYEEFHGKQIDIVATYPDMVSGELGNYDAAVCRFFTVDRKNPKVNVIHSF